MKIGHMLVSLGHFPLLIADQYDYEVWLQRSGWAVVPDFVAYEVMPQWLKSQKCVKSINGTYTAVCLAAEGALKHHAGSGKRSKVLDRDGNRCLDCRRTEADGAKLTMHHVGSFSHGYETTTRNLVTLCEECNWRRGNRGNVSDFEIRNVMWAMDSSVLGPRSTSQQVNKAMWLSDNLMHSRCEVH